MRTPTAALAALVLVALGAPVGAQQPKTAKPDHMEHRFDDPEKLAKGRWSNILAREP